MKRIVLSVLILSSAAKAGEPCPHVSNRGDFAICEFGVADFWTGWELVTPLGAIPLGGFDIKVVGPGGWRVNSSTPVTNGMKVVGGKLLFRQSGERTDLAVKCDQSSAPTLLFHGSGYQNRYFYSQVGRYQLVVEKSDEVTKATMLNLPVICQLTEAAWSDLWNFVDSFRDLWEPICSARTERPCLSEEELSRSSLHLMLTLLFRV